MEITGRKYAILYADFMAWMACATKLEDYVTTTDCNSIMVAIGEANLLFNEPRSICVLLRVATFGKRFDIADYEAIELCYEDVMRYLITKGRK